MRKKNKYLLKILAGTVAIGLISGLLFITNAFCGNPISAMLADKAIETYVDEKYPLMNLEVGKSKYSFKEQQYIATAQSRTSIDTRFLIFYQDGKVQFDNYETRVTSKFNTQQRFLNEYTFLAKSILSQELGFENNTTIVLMDRDEYKNVNNLLEIDMKFDKTLPLDKEVLIRVELKDYSLEGIEKVLTRAHRKFIENECYFNSYSLSYENKGVYVSVSDVSPADIESGELLKLLKEAENNNETGGIRVYILN